MCALDQKKLGQLHTSGVKPEEISKLVPAFFALSCLSFPFQVSFFFFFVSPRLAVYLALLFLCLAVLPTSFLMSVSISPSVFLPFLFLYSGSRPSGMEFWEW